MKDRDSLLPVFGKHFASMYSGSMFGKPAVVFAVWGYAIAHMRPSRGEGACYVELNPILLAATFSSDPETILGAIKDLCSPDERSRSQFEDGRRLIPTSDDGWHQGPAQYKVVNGPKYRAMRDEEERRVYLREAKRKERQKERGAMSFDEAGESQGWNCGCCGGRLERNPMFSLQDHDHITGSARALVCRPCNSLIGRHESGIELKHSLSMVVAYLGKWAKSTQVNPTQPSSTQAEAEAEAEAENEQRKNGLVELRSTANPVEEVFRYWQQRTNHLGARLTAERIRYLKIRLKEESKDPAAAVGGLKLAIDGAVGDGFFNGSETGRSYLNFENIFMHRGRNRIEKLQALARQPEKARANTVAARIDAAAEKTLQTLARKKLT